MEYSKENCDSIQKQNEKLLKFYYDEWNVDDDTNAVKISSDSNTLYKYTIIENKGFLTKDQITYSNLLCFMIGKILEVQKYNDNVKDINEKLKLQVPLMKINNTDILSFLPENNIQNCIDLINNNIYYSVDFYEKCKNPILPKDIFKTCNQDINTLLKVLEGDVVLLKECINKLKGCIISDFNAQYLVKTKDKNVKQLINTEFLKACYKYFMNDIVMYSYLLYYSTNEDFEYKKVIEILSNQLLNIINTQGLCNIDLQREIISRTFSSSIEQFMPYIEYLTELYEKDTYYGTDYESIREQVAGYINESAEKLSFKKKLTLQNITNTINDFFKNQLKLKYIFTFKNN